MTNNSRQAVTFDTYMDHSVMKKLKRLYNIGQIKELRMLNFMCHKNFSMQFHPTHMQIVTGANGSGKSTIANAVSLCLGAPARTTGRTSNVQSFIRKGEVSAELTIILANEGPEAFKPELYGQEIQIIRRIGIRQSSYRIRAMNGKTISTRKETVDEIMQALSISPENPLCILHQEIAKTFLINSDPGKKYQFYMKVSQLDQIKQAYEQGVWTIESLMQRVNTMKQKHVDMLRKLQPFEQEVKKIELRRDYEEKRHGLEAELLIARTDQTRQELFELQHQLDLLKKSKDNIDNQIIQEKNEILEFNQRLENYPSEKLDVETDINGLKDLSTNFAKEKHDLQKQIHSLALEHETYRQLLTEIELEEMHIRKQIEKYTDRHGQSNTTNEDYLTIDHEISVRKEKQIELDGLLALLNEDIQVNDQSLQEKQFAVDSLEKEHRQKQEELEQLIQIDQDKVNIYVVWMSDCLKTIQNDPRFHKKPIGPISRYVHCINPHWSYAVEKHLGSIMPSFICSDHDDERILIEIFSLYSSDHRPPIYVYAYPDCLPDISGTVQCIKRANLSTIADVLKIDNITVECALIDFKQIESTILVQNITEAKKLRESGILNWKKIDRKVKQVTEAWTSDGSNVKLDSIFRIYTNDRRPIKYFLSTTTKALSMEELTMEIRSIAEQFERMKESLNQLKSIRQTTLDRITQTKEDRTINQQKLDELMEEQDRLNATMPEIFDCPLEELKEKARKSREFYDDAVRQYDDAKQRHREYVCLLTDTTNNHENITRKLDEKIQEYDRLVETIHDEQSKHAQILQQLKNSTNKEEQVNTDLREYQKQIDQLSKKLTKKSKKPTANIRSVREIQQELDAITHYLQSHEDTNEIRRDIIEQYRTQRDEVRQYKQTYERCERQIERLRQFIDKRREGFQIIADQHRYYLRLKFQNLMKKYHFDDTDIQINHKKEELHLIVKRDQQNLASLSGGERSISTFCFLSSLWETIYQPFRLLDEIDIYMDNEKLNSTLSILYENTMNYSTSQHIVFTPQMIDSQFWNEFNVPVFQMPTPKRSL